MNNKEYIKIIQKYNDITSFIIELENKINIKINSAIKDTLIIDSIFIELEKKFSKRTIIFILDYFYKKGTINKK